MGIDIKVNINYYPNYLDAVLSRVNPSLPTVFQITPKSEGSVAKEGD